MRYDFNQDARPFYGNIILASFSSDVQNCIGRRTCTLVGLSTNFHSARGIEVQFSSIWVRGPKHMNTRAAAV